MIRFLNKGSSSVCEPYTKLEYLRSAGGTRKIDTLIYASSEIEFEIKYRQTTTENVNSSAYACLLGARNSTTSNGMVLFIRHGGSDAKKCLSIIDTLLHDFYLEDTESDTPEEFVDKPVTISLKNNVFSITDGTTTLSENVTDIATFVSSYKLWLFACNSGNSTNDVCKADLYYCKIWKSGALIRDFIPVIDGLNRVCLWDKVTQTFFYEVNGATFEAGYAEE